MPRLLQFMFSARSFLLNCACLFGVLLLSSTIWAEVKPTDRFPTEADTLQVIDKVTIITELYLWLNFMPGPEEERPPFYVSLQLTVKNGSNKRLVGFKAAELTLYPENSKEPFHTFGLTSDDPQEPVEIKPGQEEYFTYTNDRKKVFSPKIEKNAKFYARVKLIWGGKERVITSPVAEVEFTY